MILILYQIQINSSVENTQMWYFNIKHIQAKLPDAMCNPKNPELHKFPTLLNNFLLYYHVFIKNKILLWDFIAKKILITIH